MFTQSDSRYEEDFGVEKSSIGAGWSGFAFLTCQFFILWLNKKRRALVINK